MESATILLLAGSALGFGLRHGVDWDHIAAITDITAAQGQQRRGLFLACMYAIGHAFVVASLGLAIIVAGAQIPNWLDEVMGHFVGVTLLMLGAWTFYVIMRHGENFQMRSRWMLVFEAAKRLWDRSKRADARRTLVHEHVLTAYDVRTALAVGGIHGIGAETPTQILLFATAAGAGGVLRGSVVVVAFCLGLIISNAAIATLALFGYANARRRRRVWIGVGTVTCFYSIVVGLVFLFGESATTPGVALAAICGVAIILRPRPKPARDSILLIGHGSRDEQGAREFLAIVDIIRSRMPDQHIVPSFLEFGGPIVPSIQEGVDRCVEFGSNRVYAVPTLLFYAGHAKRDMPGQIARARARYPQLDLIWGEAFGIHRLLFEIVEQRLREVEKTLTPLDHAETAVLMIGRGTTDPVANADMHKIARLLWECNDYGWVEGGFVSLTPPNVPDAIDRCVRLGARRVLVIPYFIDTGILVKRIGDQAAGVRYRYPNAEILVGEHLGPDDRIIDLIVQRILEATGQQTREEAILPREPTRYDSLPVRRRGTRSRAFSGMAG